MAGESKGLRITRESIDAFLSAQVEKGLKKGTVDTYRLQLNRLYGKLPENKKEIGPETVSLLLTELEEDGFSTQTRNGFLTVCNQYLDFYGRRDLQHTSYCEVTDGTALELTRAEYKRMLSTARQLDKEREYLMVKAFALLGIGQNELRLLTVEAVHSGSFVVDRDYVHIPRSFAEEMMNYAREQGVLSGPIFVGREGTPLTRSYVAALIALLCDEAKVERARGNSRNLKKLYQNTMSDLRSNLELLVEQAYDRMIEKEQLTIGWDMSVRQKEHRKNDSLDLMEQAISL